MRHVSLFKFLYLINTLFPEKSTEIIVSERGQVSPSSFFSLLFQFSKSRNYYIKIENGMLAYN